MSAQAKGHYHAGSMDCNTVFVDTSLDTSIVMLVFKSDTVSDFKKKMLSDHMQCYPNMKIRIHSLKIKSKGVFYHLPDSMLVWDAFLRAKGDWFIWVDASDTPPNQNSPEPALIKRKILKRKAEKRVVFIHHNTTEVEQVLKGKNITHNAEENTEEKHFSPLTQKEAPEIISPKKSKKNEKKSSNTNSGLLSLSMLHKPEETEKEEGVLCPTREDVQLKLMKASTLNASEKADGNEPDFVMSTQTMQNLEVDTNKEPRNSDGNNHVDFLVVEKENQILEFNQVEKDAKDKHEIAGNTDLASTTPEYEGDNFQQNFVPGHSSGSTQNSSNSASMSEHPVRECDLSLNSTRNGSSDAQGRSTGEERTAKLDLSASRDMTMKMILTNSPKLKKAKLVASQNEYKPIEFVPDSLSF